MLVYNAPIPTRKVQYYLLPGWATGSKRFVGLADVRVNFLPGGAVPKVSIGVGAKTFIRESDFVAFLQRMDGKTVDATPLKTRETQ